LQWLQWVMSPADRNLLMVQVASVQQNKGGVAGLQNECVVTVHIVQVGRHVAFTLHCVTASSVERFYYCKKTKKTTTLLLATTPLLLPTPQTLVSYTVSESSIC